MRILFLNRAFHPDFEASGQVLTELAEDLGRAHEVTVVCGRPNFVPLSGRVFPWRSGSLRSVPVQRAWGTVLPKNIPAARMLNLATFYLFSRLAARTLPRARQMGLRGRLAAEHYYDRAKLTAESRAVLEALVDGYSSSASKTVGRS